MIQYYCQTGRCATLRKWDVQFWSKDLLVVNAIKTKCVTTGVCTSLDLYFRDDLSKWNFFPRYWPSGVLFIRPRQKVYTVRCRYNAVNFLTNIHKRHPIARPLGRAMWRLLWIQHLIDILPQSLWLFMWYLTIFDRVITARDCIWYTPQTHCHQRWCQNVLILS